MKRILLLAAVFTCSFPIAPSRAEPPAYPPLWATHASGQPVKPYADFAQFLGKDSNADFSGVDFSERLNKLQQSTQTTGGAPSLRPIQAVSVNIAPAGGLLPPDATAGMRSLAPIENDAVLFRQWGGTRYAWEAPGLTHGPLYFQDVNLERYGNSAAWFLQPFASMVRFFATVPMLPYKMAIDPPGKQIYTLGYYRPGDPAPNLCYRPPVRLTGLAAEAALVAGLILLFP